MLSCCWIVKAFGVLSMFADMIVITSTATAIKHCSSPSLPSERKHQGDDSLHVLRSKMGIPPCVALSTILLMMLQDSYTLTHVCR